MREQLKVVPPSEEDTVDADRVADAGWAMVVGMALMLVCWMVTKGAPVPEMLLASVVGAAGGLQWWANQKRRNRG